MLKESNLRVEFSNPFKKQLKKAPLEIKVAFNNRYQLFLEAPFTPILNNHPLIGKYLGHRSINITGDWRALYTEYETLEEEQIVGVIKFEVLGTHSQLYG